MDGLIKLTTDAQGASVGLPSESAGVVSIHTPFLAGGKLLLETDEDSKALQLPANASVHCQELEALGLLQPGKAYVFETLAGLLIRRFDGITDGVVQLSSVKPAAHPAEHIPLSKIQRVYSVEWKSVKEG